MTKTSGRLQYFTRFWHKLTNDPTILSWIKGYKIPFSSPPIQSDYPKNNLNSVSDISTFQSEINKLLDKGAISPCCRVDGDFLSSIFLVDKPNGDKRFILNLKKLNKFITPPHFKMEDIRTAIKLVTPNCFLATIDLKDAYYLLPIHSNYKKYLRFEFQEKVYEFNCLPFGLNTAPLVFTKLMKPVMEHLRLHGWLSTIFLDDILLIDKTYSQCERNVKTTIDLLKNLGFLINYEKSSIIPKTSCKFLGFVLNMDSFCLQLPQDKINKVLREIENIYSIDSCKIRDFAKFIGLLTSICPAIEYGWLHTKIFERQKFLKLSSHKNYDKIMKLDKKLLNEDLHWWFNNVDKRVCPIRPPLYDIEIFSDASLTGWGASYNNEKANGFWTDIEKTYHINVLELLAVLFALNTFAKHYNNTQILLRVDNTTAISCINRMGSIQYPHLHEIARKIWEFCEQRNLFIFASYIRSSDNTIADFESRRSQNDTEWELASYAFLQIVTAFGAPEIDLFATRSNSKCDKYVSWKADPYAVCIDAFTIKWSDLYFYAFPPFAIILKTLNKIINDKATGIIVVPHWPTQPWFPVFKRLVVSKVVFFKPNSNLLISDNSRIHHHSLHKSLTLAAAVLSGKHY